MGQVPDMRGDAAVQAAARFGRHEPDEKKTGFQAGRRSSTHIRSSPEKTHNQTKAP